MKQEVGVEMRSQLDAEIAFTDRKLKEALRAKEMLERALNPANESGNAAAQWWADMDDLATAIADYKSALERRRQREDATLSQLTLQIQNGQGWLTWLEQDTWKQFWAQLKLNAALQADRDRLRQQHEPNTGLFGLSIPAGGQTNSAEHDAEGKMTEPDHGGPGHQAQERQAQDHSQRSEPQMLEAGHGSLAETHNSKDGLGVEVHNKD